MDAIEIFFDDLKEEKQKEILEKLGDNGNYDVCPIATIEVEDEDFFEDSGDCPYSDSCSYSESCHHNFDAEALDCSQTVCDISREDDYEEMQSMADQVDGVRQ